MCALMCEMILIRHDYVTKQYVCVSLFVCLSVSMYAVSLALSLCLSASVSASLLYLYLHNII